MQSALLTVTLEYCQSHGIRIAMVLHNDWGWVVSKSAATGHNLKQCLDIQQ